MKRSLVYVIVFLIVSASLSHAANLIANADFENGNYEPARESFVTLNANSNRLDSWTIGLGGIDWIGSLWAPPLASAGPRSIDLNAGDAGSISQSFFTELGKTYMVSFYLAGNPNGGARVVKVNVSVPGTTQEFSFDTTGHSDTNMGWDPRFLTFGGTGALTTLTFTSTLGGSYGPALDVVSVVEVTGPAVPEPSVLGLLGCGLLGLLVTRRRMSA